MQLRVAAFAKRFASEQKQLLLTLGLLQRFPKSDCCVFEIQNEVQLFSKPFYKFCSLSDLFLVESTFGCDLFFPLIPGRKVRGWGFNILGSCVEFGRILYTVKHSFEGFEPVKLPLNTPMTDPQRL